MDPRAVGMGSVVLAAILWGTTGTVQAILPESRDPLAVGALRLAFGALALMALALARAETRRGLMRLPWRGIAFAGAAIGLYNLLFFHAVSAAGIGVGTAVTIGSAPVWATAWEWLVERCAPGGRRLAGQGLAILGVTVLAAGFGLAGSVTGIVLALGAGASYAAYSLATSRVGCAAPSTSVAAATFACAALLTAPILIVAPLDWIAAPADWVALAFLGVGATGLSYALYTWGLTRVAASTAVTLALAEPVTAWVLATLWIGEAVTGTGLVGSGLILAGLTVVTTARRRDPA